MSSDPQAAIQCEACEAGMRRAADGIHYKDGPNYKGPQTGSTWGVCRKVVAASRDPQAAIDPRGVIDELSRLADAFPVGHDMRRLCSHAAALLEQAQRETERVEREAFDQGRAHALLHLASATRKVLSPELVRLVEAEMRRGLMAQYMPPTGDAAS